MATLACGDHLRERKKKKSEKTVTEAKPEKKVSKKGKPDVKELDINKSNTILYLTWLSTLIGLVVMVAIGIKYAGYLSEIHENDMWFSNIQELEREISFRTESGLYYSYYKQLVNAPSFAQGMYEITHDNLTEHPNTINVLARMNIYQEVVLAALYRNLPSVQASFQPVFWYISAVFSLHGMLICAVFSMAWLLSGTWIAGALAACFYIFNKEDTTRVPYVIPLRESFSLPFLWVQLVLLTVYFRPAITQTVKRLCEVGIFLSTLGFAVCWQFNQFVLLLQAMALFGMQALELVPFNKLRYVYLSLMATMLVVCVLQYGNLMVLSGLMLSFIPAAFIIMNLQSKGLSTSSGGLVSRFFKLIINIILVLALMFIFNTVIKVVIQQDADEHIYKFILVKFGLGNSRDFDVKLYLCNGAFEFLSSDTFGRLTSKWVFPFYAVSHIVCLVLLATTVLQKWNREISSDGKVKLPVKHVLSNCPELCYHIIQIVFFGALAMSTLRMKYLWTPYMCVLGSVGVSHRGLWSLLLRPLGVTSRTVVDIVRFTVAAVVLSLFLYQVLPPAAAELKELREFFDPDTVELMEWIKASTPVGAAFSGSMQLLAGVKLCTGRPITNHPHYEDTELRHRTKQLYQMYGRQPPSDVHHILRQYNASYIILEDSICLSNKNDGCRLPDLIDMDNGQIPDSGREEPGLHEDKTPRFCNEIRHGKPAFTRKFKSVFENKTFRVYEVLS